MLACEPPVVDGGEEGGVLCGEVERLCSRWRWKSPRNTLPTLFELIDCAIRVDYFGNRDGEAAQHGLQQSNNRVHKGLRNTPWRFRVVDTIFTQYTVRRLLTGSRNSYGLQLGLLGPYVFLSLSHVAKRSR